MTEQIVVSPGIPGEFVYNLDFDLKTWSSYPNTSSSQVLASSRCCRQYLHDEDQSSTDDDEAKLWLNMEPLTKRNINILKLVSLLQILSKVSCYHLVPVNQEKYCQIKIAHK